MCTYASKVNILHVYSKVSLLRFVCQRGHCGLGPREFDLGAREFEGFGRSHAAKPRVV